MKAICGSIHLDGAPAVPNAVAALRAALLGRGIAQEQAWHDAAAAFAGVTWLPGAEGSLDPTVYTDPESGCVIVADALLFERAELAAAAALPSTAHSAWSDAQLILHAYLRWGEDCAARLDGDFAFVVWDPRKQRVYAARDGMGVRPLYFHHAPGRLFAFASNASAVTASPMVSSDLNEVLIADFLVGYGRTDLAATPYRAVRRLSPAHWCSVDARGYREACYWMPGDRPPAVLPSGDAEWTQAVREALERAVRQHVIAGCRVGSMLSGGLDSSAIAAIAADLLAADGSDPLRTFSAINSADPDCAETRAIRAMLARPGFAPAIADATRLDALLPELVPRIAACEELYDGFMGLVHTQYLLAARAGVGAVFDGGDADTLFSEGNQMARLLRAGRLRTAYSAAVGMSPFYGPGWPAWKQLAVAAPVAFVPESFKRSVRGLRRRHELRKCIRDSLIAPDFARRALLNEPLQVPDMLDRQHVRDGSQTAVLRERCDAIRIAGLTLGVERYRRVASMHGIEPRHPFLDRRLIELCVHLPDRQRTRDGWHKAVLREALATRLPAEVCFRRSKEHLGGKFNQVLFDRDQRAHLDELWEHRDVLAPYVDIGKLNLHIQRYRHNSEAENADLVFDIWYLLLWLRRQRQQPS